MDMEDHPPVMRLASPPDVLAAIPSLLGYHPSDSLVILVVDAGDTVTVRCDIPDQASIVPKIVGELLRRSGFAPSPDGGCFVVGYGTAEQAAPSLAACAEELRSRGWRLFELLRVEGDRFWSLLCSDPLCCPPEGRLFDNRSHETTAALVLAGRPLPLPDRQAVADRVASRFVPGMQMATEEAMRRWIAAAELAEDRDDVLRHMAKQANSLTQTGLDLQRRGQRLSDEAAVELAITLVPLPVRDRIWVSIEAGPDLQVWLDLWCDLTRRLPPQIVAPCASLAGFCAWLNGDSVLAAAAFERALTETPHYSMARLFRQAMDSGLHPSSWEETRREARDQLGDL